MDRLYCRRNIKNRTEGIKTRMPHFFTCGILFVLFFARHAQLCTVAGRTEPAVLSENAAEIQCIGEAALLGYRADGEFRVGEQIFRLTDPTAHPVRRRRDAA